MIVHSMMHAEVYRELDADRENLERWWDHRYDEYRRRALKTTKFPVSWKTEYVSPRKNQYILIVTCTRRRFEGYYGCVLLALRKEKHGYTVYLTKLNQGTIMGKTVFLPHFFDRYAERAGIDKSGVDLIRHFFANQSGGYILSSQQLASRSVRYNGRDHRFMAIHDGVLLGDLDDDIFIVRTFITYDMAGIRQSDEFTYARGQLHGKEEEIRHVNRIAEISELTSKLRLI